MEIVLAGLSHHDIFEVLLRLSLLLVVARLLGELTSRMGQPSVIGEILAGIILGPSILGFLWPGYSDFILPQDAIDVQLLDFMQIFGALFLLLLTGLEIDFGLIKRQFSTALSVAAGGLIVPFASGYLLALVTPDSLLLPDTDRTVFALFLGTAMAISAIPVIAKVLMDLRLTRRSIAQVIIASAMIDDAVGWVLLSVVSTLAVGEALGLLTVSLSLLKVGLFLSLGVLIGRSIMTFLLRFIQERVREQEGSLALIICALFAFGAIAQFLHLEAIFGAFVLGVALSLCPRVDHQTIHTLETLGLKVFGPLFFAIAGLKVDLTLVLSSDIAGFALIFLGVAIISKLGGAYLGARILAKVEHWPAVLFGSGLTARGSMGIIIATVGLSLQIVSPSMFSVLILMAIGTSLVSPPLIRWSVSHIPIDAEEQARLEREQMGKENPFMQMQRILLPVRFWPNHQPHSAVKRLIVDRLAQRHGIALTIVTVVSEHQREDAKKFLDTLVLDYAAKEISTKVLIGDDSADLILNESQRGYDLLIVGASQKANRPVEVLFTPFVDYIVRLAPCPVLLVKEDMGTEHHDTLSRVLVPTNGSVASRRACQLACSILRSDREESLVFINVVEALLGPRGERMLQRQRGYAGQNIEELTKLAGAEGLSCEGSIRISPEPGAEILSAINGLRADLVVLGISVRAGSDRLFLGPRVERILRDSPVPVLILNS